MEVIRMGSMCTTDSCCTSRSFLTKEEKIEKLNEYSDALDKESQGVKERIKELEK